jgi:hypothetical protein
MNNCHLTERIRIKHPTPISEINKVNKYEYYINRHGSFIMQKYPKYFMAVPLRVFPSLQSSITLPKGPKMPFKWKLTAEKFGG